ncbi:helix-turn-helix domain-containing protein [Bacillus sp. 1P02SD]|uniref:helix-turn-helix domain-containing protein n=1 Tax=Bacillus sp. 1P02SD TaxID=3132264 RepID=UPI0039A0393B
MKRGEYLTKVMEEKGYNPSSLSKASGVPYTTIRSMIERNLDNASVDNVIKICDVLGISIEVFSKENIDDGLPELNKKDERDIQKKLQEMIDALGTEGYAAFDGKDIDELDEEDKELLISSLENSLRLAKRIAKEKYTPKKYKK